MNYFINNNKFDLMGICLACLTSFWLIPSYFNTNSLNDLLAKKTMEIENLMQSDFSESVRHLLNGKTVYRYDAFQYEDLLLLLKKKEETIKIIDKLIEEAELTQKCKAGAIDKVRETCLAFNKTLVEMKFYNSKLILDDELHQFDEKLPADLSVSQFIAVLLLFKMECSQNCSILFQNITNNRQYSPFERKRLNSFVLINRFNTKNKGILTGKVALGSLVCPKEQPIIINNKPFLSYYGMTLYQEKTPTIGEHRIITELPLTNAATGESRVFRDTFYYEVIPKK